MPSAHTECQLHSVDVSSALPKHIAKSQYIKHRQHNMLQLQGVASDKHQLLLDKKFLCNEGMQDQDISQREHHQS